MLRRAGVFVRVHTFRVALSGVTGGRNGVGEVSLRDRPWPTPNRPPELSPPFRGPPKIVFLLVESIGNTQLSTDISPFMLTGAKTVSSTFVSRTFARLSFPAARPSARFISHSAINMSPAPVNAAQPDQKYGWAISEKAAGELQDGKVDVWTVFSPASGQSLTSDSQLDCLPINAQSRSS